MEMKSNVSYLYDVAAVRDEETFPPATLLLNDPEYDETTVDLEEPECVTITQTDEAGKVHTVILGRTAMHRLLPYLKQWNAQNP